MWLLLCVLWIGAVFASIDDYVKDDYVKIAFLGDTGVGLGFQQLLRKLKKENVEAIVHAGDFDYIDDPAAFEKVIKENLGDKVPYFASIGNHDVKAWDGEKGYARLFTDKIRAFDNVYCDGEFGINSLCTFNGIDFLLSGAGTKGTDHETFALKHLKKHPSPWKFCSFHKLQRKLQTGKKNDETGYGIYEACRKTGAIVIGGHSHTYSRTKLMDDFTTQNVVDDESSDMLITPGKSFSIVNGVGGRKASTTLPELYEQSWFVTSIGKGSGIKAAALVCKLQVKNYSIIKGAKGSCKLVDITGKVWDSFKMRSTVDLPDNRVYQFLRSHQ
jgi:predicted phosphodiesterase